MPMNTKYMKYFIVTIFIAFLIAYIGDFYYRGQTGAEEYYRYFGTDPESISSFYCDGICLLESGWPFVTNTNWADGYNYLGFLANWVLFSIVVFLLLVPSSYLIRIASKKGVK